MVMVGDMIARAKAYAIDTCYDLRDHFSEDIWAVYIVIAWGLIIMFSGKVAVYLFGFEQ